MFDETARPRTVRILAIGRLNLGSDQRELNKMQVPERLVAPMLLTVQQKLLNWPRFDSQGE
jgi:hypothetical protein